MQSTGYGARKAAFANIKSCTDGCRRYRRPAVDNTISRNAIRSDEHQFCHTVRRLPETVFLPTFFEAVNRFKRRLKNGSFFAEYLYSFFSFFLFSLSVFLSFLYED